MKIKQIIQQLDPTDLQGIVSRFGVPPEQLEPYLSQEHIFVQNYRALSKRYRQIYDFLYLNSPEIPISQLRKKFNVNRHDLKILQERGLLFLFPSLRAPEKVTIPLEYLFFDEIPLTDENSMITVFRDYQTTRLFKVANHYQIPPKTTFSQFASVLYTRIIQNASDEFAALNTTEREILHYVIDHGGLVTFDNFMKKFYRQINAFHAKHRSSIDDFLGLNQLGSLTDMQMLFIRCFLVFVKDSPSTDELKIAIPAEIFQTLTKPYLESRARKKRKLVDEMLVSALETTLISNTEQLENDLKKLLLLIVNLNPRITSSGMPFKTDLRQMLRLLGNDRKYWLFLIDYAKWLGIILPENSHFRVMRDATTYFHLSNHEHYLLARKFLKETLYQDDEEGESRDQAIHYFAEKILIDFRKDRVKVSLGYNYAGFLPEFRQLYEEYKSCKAAFIKKIQYILKRYFWLGLVDATADFKIVQFSRAGQYAVGGLITPFQSVKIAENKFFVQPSSEIIADSNIPFETLLQLAQLCEIVSVDVAIRFQISRQQIINFAQQGYSISEVLEFFKTNSKNPLPQTVEFLLKDIEQKEGEVELIPVSGYLQFKDKQLFEAVKILLHDYIITTVADELILLKSNVELSYVEKLIKQKGLFIKSRFRKTVPEKKSVRRLGHLLETLEQPPFNTNDLPFGNPAFEKDDIQRLLQFSIEHQIRVKMEYQNDSLSNTVRKVEPQRMNENILEAYCHSREMTRAFLIDRIKKAELFR